MTVHHGDCLEVMPTLHTAVIDAIVTDPPYGIRFMGKAWDGAAIEEQAQRRAGQKQPPDKNGNPRKVPRLSRAEAAGTYNFSLTGNAAFQAWCEQWAVEALRVAKPGAFMLVCGGPRTFHRMTAGVEDAGWEIRDCLNWLYGSGFPKSHNGVWGGTALKPAWEPIILARKPLTRTVAANHAEYGTGALNVDGCRIDANGERPSGSGAPSRNSIYSQVSTSGGNGGNVTPTAGRWPANVALDEEAAAALDEQSGTLQSGQPMGVKAGGRGNAFGHFDGGIPVTGFGDSGGASRFFYTAKASRAERNAGVEKNHHPTVKPLDLMQWLCRLVTPKGGLILDPFCGSGTTGRAAVAEGFRFIGIEKEAEYVEIARARIAEYAPLFNEKEA